MASHAVSPRSAPYPDRLIAAVSRAGKQRVLAAALVALAILAYADYYAPEDVTLGVLYVIPLMIAAVVLDPPAILLLAAAAAALRVKLYQPATNLETALRFAFGLVAYLGTGLFMVTLTRNRQLVIDHLNQISREQALRRVAEEQLRTLAESSPAGILTLNENGVVIAANQASNVLLAVEEGQTVIGRPIRDYLPVLADALQLAANLEPFHTAAQCQGTKATGEIFPAQTWFSTYRAPEGTRLAAIFVDSSEEMRDREEQKLRELATSNRITAAAVSHELRNFCAAIALIYSNLRDEHGALREDRFAELAVLVKSLESIASMDLESRAADAPEAVSLQQVLDDLRIVIEPGWHEAGGTISWELPETLPMVLGLRHGLLQAFLNLAQNSLRAVEDCAKQKLSINVSCTAQSTVVRFHDSGPGVSDPLRLFQPFQPGAEVAGLGLYVSRAILRSYGGDLRYEAPPKGACFAVELHTVREKDLA